MIEYHYIQVDNRKDFNRYVAGRSELFSRFIIPLSHIMNLSTS